MRLHWSMGNLDLMHTPLGHVYETVDADSQIKDRWQRHKSTPLYWSLYHYVIYSLLLLLFLVEIDHRILLPFVFLSSCPLHIDGIVAWEIYSFSVFLSFIFIYILSLIIYSKVVVVKHLCFCDSRTSNFSIWPAKKYIWY